MTKHKYICKICDVVREKSDCIKRKVGAVAINTEFEILATGFNGPPRKFAHCDGGETCGNPCTRNIHAEQNLICQAAKRGVVLYGAVLYCTYAPCVTCARMLVNVGIIAVHIKDPNRDGGLGVLSEAKIPVSFWGETK